MGSGKKKTSRDFFFMPGGKEKRVKQMVADEFVIAPKGNAAKWRLQFSLICLCMHIYCERKLNER